MTTAATFKAKCKNWLKKVLGIRLGILRHYRPRALSLPRSYSQLPTLSEFPTIAIAVPSYNQEAYLEQTLKSVLDQGYPRLELSVQDAGSRDGSTRILERYAPQLVHWESRKDRGQAHAINLAFSHTTGSIMAYLNSDDLILPGSLHYVAAFFSRHPDVDVVYGQRILIDEHDQDIGRWIVPGHDDRVMCYADYVPQETLFWRRRTWDQAGGFMDESFQFALDWDLLLRFRAAGAKFARLPRFLGAFRVHSQQKTTTQREAVGMGEMAELRTRHFGREVSLYEVRKAVLPFLIRSAGYHWMYKLRLVRY